MTDLQRLQQLGAAELARRLLICERGRKHWRILAVQGVLGHVNIAKLKHVCFKELLGISPGDDDLTRQMDETVALLVGEEKSRTDILEMFGRGARIIDL